MTITTRLTETSPWPANKSGLNAAVMAASALAVNQLILLYRMKTTSVAMVIVERRLNKRGKVNAIQKLVQPYDFAHSAQD